MVTNLKNVPKYFRGRPSKGIVNSDNPVDRDGGNMGFGVIYGISVITRGPALGHGVWIDKEFIKDTHDAINASEKGVKSRFTHPSLSSDGMGKYLGKITNAKLVDDGDQVIADLHFSETSHKSPDGDLAEYVMNLADEAPDIFGTSIVFNRDFEKEDQFYEKHTRYNEEKKHREFVSPDKLNTENLMHVRLGELYADDVVDEPAANPDGLFDRNPIARNADKVLEYALGMTNEMPSNVGEFDIHPVRMRQFLTRFMDNHGIGILHKEGDMPNSKKTDSESLANHETEQVEESETTETTTDDSVAESEADESGEDNDVAESETSRSNGNELSEGQRFINAFGREKGGAWFAESVPFDEAQALFNKELRDENDQLKALLSDARGSDVVEYNTDPDPEVKENTGLKSAFRVAE